jgi:amino acid adenylation domain-containing protein
LSAPTIGADLAAAAAAAPDEPAVIAASGTLTYAELDAAASRLAAGLAGLGVERGDRVSTLLPNDLDMVVSIYGVMRAGAVLSPLHPTVKSEKLSHLLGHAGSTVLLTDAAHGGTARDGAPGVAVVEAGGELSGEAAPEPPVAEDLAAILYTSGSTGEPNGVTLAHRNMTFVADSIIEYLGMRADDRTLCALPLSFGYGLYQLLTTVRTGGTLVLRPGIGLLGDLVRILEEERITFLPGVPTLFELLITFEGLGDRDLPQLRALTNAGAGLPVATVERLRELLPKADLFCMYGQTECQRVCYLPPAELDARMGSVGIAIPRTEVWIEGEDGDRVEAADEVGELFVRGGHVMQGYWNDPDATARKVRVGPGGERVLATGDLFRQDADGYLYFVSRRDDIIKSRGEKVVPKEVEEVLRAADGVGEAAVIGVPDRLLGQAVQAHVAPQPGAELDERTLLARCAAHLEDYMVPRQIVIHESLPKTANGKLDKRALADAG